MEKLSIEEKAKRYDEALERAKEIIECSKSNSKEVRMVLSFFPELKESEGENICRKLIAFLKQCKAVYGDGFKQFGLEIDDAIAWLEEKKESPNLYSGDIEVLKEVISAYENGTFPFLKEDRIRMAERLKAIRPTKAFKPSDEQMKALKEAVDEHFDIDGGALWHLYEDLKKLREE